MGGWSNSLFGCFSDVKLCVLTYFAPCYVAGKVAETVGEDGVKFAALSMVPLVNIFCLGKLRTKVRAKRGIDGSNIMDMLLHCICGCCALHQESSEMNAIKVDDLAKDMQKDIERV